MSRIYRNGRDYSGSSAQIDDNTAANNKVYSSAKVESIASGLQTNINAKQNTNVLNIRKTYPQNTSLSDVILDCISTYGKVSMMIGAIITGYGFVHIMLCFSDDGQGGGTIVANNKHQSGTQAAFWAFQYTNGTVTLSYVYQ